MSQASNALDKESLFYAIFSHREHPSLETFGGYRVSVEKPTFDPQALASLERFLRQDVQYVSSQCDTSLHLGISKVGNEDLLKGTVVRLGPATRHNADEAQNGVDETGWENMALCFIEHENGSLGLEKPSESQFPVDSLLQTQWDGKTQTFHFRNGRSVSTSLMSNPDDGNSGDIGVKANSSCQDEAKTGYSSDGEPQSDSSDTDAKEGNGQSDK